MTTLAYPASVYPVTLSFKKVFTSGILQGLTVSDSMHFVSEERAEAWLKGVAANYKRGVLDYYVQGAVIAKREEEKAVTVRHEIGPFKGFVQWANEAKESFFWTNGKDVFRASIYSEADVSTGYVQGRWESTVGHWNKYAQALGRARIK